MRWMELQHIPNGPYLAVYRCRFTVVERRRIEFKFSADEYAQVFLDGEHVTEGPERGCPERWYWQDVSMDVGLGSHILVFRVNCFGPGWWWFGQMTVHHGLCVVDGSGLLSDWEAQEVGGCSYSEPFPDWGSCPRVEVAESFQSELLDGGGDGWLPVAFFDDNRPMADAELPNLRYDATVPESRGDGVFYFPVYSCCWSEYRFTGHGKAMVKWAETPYLTDKFDGEGTMYGEKGNRDGKVFIGKGDVFHVNGELRWRDCWWRAGHYVVIETDGDVKCEMNFFRTGYPFPEYKGTNDLAKMAYETLQACSCYGFMDCPYYEQLMYIGDTRLETWTMYRLCDDHRLARKAIRMFAMSQEDDGLMLSQYPSKSHQVIPSYMSAWFLMLHDYWLHHPDDGFLQEMKPYAQKLLDFFKRHIKDGLLVLDGWSFFDWCRDWERGVPPCATGEPDSCHNLFFALALKRLAETGLLDGLKELSDSIIGNVRQRFYCKEKRLFSVDLAHSRFAEHSQALAVLCGICDDLDFDAQGLSECTIYFSFYYLEACRALGREDLVQKRLSRWRNLREEGLTTLPEEFGVTRSDCHAWGAYILAYIDA